MIFESEGLDMSTFVEGFPEYFGQNFGLGPSVRKNLLRRQGRLGEMIEDALSVTPMTPGDLVACLVSEPYSLAPTEENLQNILRIINERSLVNINFEKDPDNSLKVLTLLSL